MADRLRVRSSLAPITFVVIFTLLAPGMAWAASSTIAWQQQAGDPAKADMAAASAVDSSGNLFVGGLTTGNMARPVVGATDAFFSKYDAAGALLWTKQFGPGDVDSVDGIAAGPGGAIYVAGSVSGALPGQRSRGGVDAYLRKYGPGGAVLWTRQFGTAGTDLGKEVAVGPDGTVYIVGTTDSALPGQTARGKLDVFIRKYTDAGSARWTRQFGTSENDLGSTVAVDALGRVYVGGSVGAALPGRRHLGRLDAFLRRFSASGKGVWTRQFGSSNDDGAGEVVIDSAQNIFLAGFRGQTALAIKFKPNGDRSWKRTFSSHVAGGAAVDSQDNFYLVGTNLAGSQPKAFATKLTGAGATVWSRDITAGIAFDAATGADDSLYAVGLAGSLTNLLATGNDALIVKFE